jgi:hypothetical protein
MKKVFLFAGVIAMISFSCQKEVATTSGSASSPAVAKKAVLQPSPNFSITFNGQGTFTASEMHYINSFPQVKTALQTIASNATSAFSIDVNEEGMIASSNNYYDGLRFFDALKNYGNFYFAATKNLTVRYGSQGYISISNPDIFQILPDLEERLIANGDIIKDEIAEGEELSIMISNDEVFINGKASGILTEDLAEFNRCTSYYWYLGSTISAIMCAYTLFTK